MCDFTSNVRKNFPRGSKLPCGLTWNDIDIGISILPKSELFKYVENTGGDAKKLSHLKLLIITTIYEGVVEGQLRAAYLKYGFSELGRPDYRAKFENCNKDKSDVHYRMPGVPDYAVRIWFSLIATGLLEDAKMHGAIKYYGGKICKSKSNPVMEYEC